MEFRPNRWLGTLLGLTVVALALTLATLLARRLFGQPVTFLSFAQGVTILGLLFLAGLFAFWSYGCWSLRYTVDRRQLTIRWGTTEHRIPLTHIQDLVLGADLPKAPKIEGVNWLGHHVGKGYVPEVGEVLFYTAHRSLNELVYVLTPGLGYALSTAAPERLVWEVRLRQQWRLDTGATAGVSHWRLLASPFWRDGWVKGLFLLGVVLNGTAFGYACYFVPVFADLLPLRFASFGSVTQIRSPDELLLLPAVALGVLALNLMMGAFLFNRERLAAYFCLLAAVVAQGLVLVAAVSLAL